MSQVIERYEGRQAIQRGATGTPYRDAVSSADSVDLSTPLAPGSVAEALLRTTEGRKNGFLRASFSGAAATVVAIIALYVKTGSATRFLGSWRATLTATTNTDGARYFADLFPFDLAGATHYEVRLALPSAGNVTLDSWEV